MPWLKSLTSPSEADDPRKKLLSFFAATRPSEVYTLPEIAEKLEKWRSDVLVILLAELSRDRIIDQVFRVESPKNCGGIEDFYELSKVPDKIFDWRQRKEINVEPRMVRVLFRRHVDEDHSGPVAR